MLTLIQIIVVISLFFFSCSSLYSPRARTKQQQEEVQDKREASAEGERERNQSGEGAVAKRRRLIAESMRRNILPPREQERVRAERELAKARRNENYWWEKTKYHNDRGEEVEAAAAYVTLQLAIEQRKQIEARMKSAAKALSGPKQARSGSKKTMETYGDCGTATGRDDRTNEKIHVMTCRGYGKNAMLLAFVVRNREPQLEIRLTPADIGKETKRFRDDQDGSVAVAILIDKRPVLNRFALWDAPSDMALLYETDVFHSLLKDVAKGYKATIQIGEMVRGTVELGGSAAAIRDLRERAGEDGISLSPTPTEPGS